MDEVALGRSAHSRAAARAVVRCVAVALLLALPASLALVSVGAQAQTLPGCTAVSRDDPPRQVLDCGNGLVIEREAAAALTAEEPQSRLDIEGRAVLIEVSPRDFFQVLTPHAIATVRGTRFVVDVEAGVTSVFVVEGKVEVAHREGAAAVLLGPGEGVDVSPGAPLVVRRWPQPRVNALLARFGR
ncbi:FecR domain-containing protein [Jiella avicenniae]|uniref:FecR family protein n=1 Tax=Jiella avicenniae TaxID=2907202 RepID=A0A9X1P3W0_9HYPH|nr:FecR domain-containing protein [Jiella avicenniae]MCE7030907.1 FecR family protein [Jiella avicenniae]